MLHSVGLRTNLETMPINSPAGASCSVPNWKLDQSLERPVCCLSGPNKSELGHLKDLCQTLLKIISNPEKERPKQKEGTTAQKNPCQGFTSFSLAIQSKYAFNWFCSVVVCKAGEPEGYKGLKTYILWWFTRHRTELPITLLHRNLNYVMECGVTNLFCNIEQVIEGGLCQVNIPREGTLGSIGLHRSVLCFY
jgi:hypothetical protein